MVLLRCAGNCATQSTVCGGRLRPHLVTMSSADREAPRVRVGVPNSELLADATTVKKEINEVGVGSFKMTFNHDMTSSFKWGGIILLLIILKVVRKGKAAFTDEPTASGVSLPRFGRKR